MMIICKNKIWKDHLQNVQQSPGITIFRIGLRNYNMQNFLRICPDRQFLPRPNIDKICTNLPGNTIWKTLSRTTTCQTVQIIFTEQQLKIFVCNNFSTFAKKIPLERQLQKKFYKNYEV